MLQLRNMRLFGDKKQKEESFVDFSYLGKDALYFDSACQTLRPQIVIDSMVEYFHEYNSCGGRVKYDWGKKVDSRIEETKKLILDYFNKSSSDYSVAFTLNTTTGLNIILSQLKSDYNNIITTDIEHNSVFLPTISLARRIGANRVVVSRKVDGSVDFENDIFKNKSVFVANNVSNIDGRQLYNIAEGTKKIHENGGIVIIDAAQGFIYGRDILKKTDFDALSFSGHKIYGPSLGVIVIKNSLLSTLENSLLGGGMVEDVSIDDFSPVKGEHLSSLLELGLQDYAGIIGLLEALKWIKKNDNKTIDACADKIFSWLKNQPSITVVNEKVNPVISFYSSKIDSHQLAIYLSEQGIMARSGYFCCHYYLKNVMNYPPLLRISLGRHNTMEQADKFISILEIILKNIK